MGRTVHFLPDSPYSNWYVTNCHKTGLASEAEFYCINDCPQFIDAQKTTLLTENSDRFLMIIDKINSGYYSKVVINYLGLYHAFLINAISNNKVLVFWIAWSEDLYSLPKLGFKKYDPYSKAYSTRQEKLLKKNMLKPKYTLKQKLGRLKMIYIDGIDLNGKKNWEHIYKAIRRVNYFATGIQEEQKIIQKKLNKRIKWFPFAYISATNGIDVTNSFDAEKEYILIGNSADPSNNQYEVVDKLHQLNVTDKILLPLSYGDKEYAHKLINDMTGFVKSNQLLILSDFMEKTEYYQLLKKVKSAIFAHNIQQAFGNIIALLAFGAKVFLKKENFLYKQLKNWDIHVFCIEDNLTLENVSAAFDKKSMAHNQSVIFDLLSQEKVDQYYVELLKV